MSPKRTPENVGEVICNFLKRLNLFQEETPWVIRESTLGDIGVFATRDIQPGEEIFKDFPVIIGPRTIPTNFLFCAVCYQKNNLNPCPNKCGLPLCSPQCTYTHELECRLIRTKRKSKYTNVDKVLFKNLTPLRSLLNSEEDKIVVTHLKSHRGDIHGKEIDKLKEIGFEFENSEEEYLRFICCVMDANAFEVLIGGESNHSNLRGLYPLASLVNHSCSPNIMHVFDGNKLMVVRACVPIKQGEELFHSYARLIWGTPTRLFRLFKTKHFVCRCSRCCDPTEYGSYMSAILCKMCKGNVISKNPLKLKSDWICEDCQGGVKRIEVANLMSMLGSILRSFDSENIGVMVKLLNEKLPQLVPPNNEICVELKYKLVWIIGYHENYSWKDIDAGMLAMKIQLCQDLLKLVESLRLGECNMKGLLLYELFLCFKEKHRRNALESPTKNSSNKDEEILADLLKQASMILKDDVTAPKHIRNLLYNNQILSI